LAVHGVFRNTLGNAPGLLLDVAEGDTARVALLANFYENVLKFLEVHHEGEEELLFPLLRARCPEERATIERVAGQHTDTHDLVTASSRALADWSAGGAASQEESAAALSRLGERLTVHLDDEERELLPLCAEHVSPPEWGALPAHGMAGFQGDKIWLILGLIRERMTPAQRDAMLAHMPPPAVEMWTGFGEQAFTGLMAEVGPPLA